MVRVGLVALLVVVDASVVVHERMERRVDGDWDRTQSGDGLQHLRLVAGRQVDEAAAVAADLFLLEAAATVLGLVGIGLLRVYAAILLWFKITFL